MWRRYPCIRQNDASDCGAAALATLALHHGKHLGLQQARELAGTDSVGTNLGGVLQAAERLGFRARAAKGTFEALLHASLPLIAHVRTEAGLGHFVVVYEVRAKKVVLADPAEGIVTWSGEEFRERWSGYLILATPDQVAAPSSLPPSSFGRLLRLLQPHRGLLAQAFLCALVLSLFGLSTGFFLQVLVDHVLVLADGRLLQGLAMGMLGLSIFGCVFSVVRQLLLAHVGRKVDLLLISTYNRHLLHLPLNFFATRRTGEILSRVHDAVKIREAISGTTLTALVDGTLVVLSATAMFLFDLPLALLTCAFLPALVGLLIVHHPAIRKRSRRTMEHAASLQAHLVEDISAVQTIKQFGLERTRAVQGEEALVKVVQSGYGLEKLGISMSSLAGLLTSGAGVAVLWVGGQRILTGELTIGQLLFFYTLLGSLLGPLARLASLNLPLQDALVALERLYQILELSPEQGYGKQGLKFAGLQSGIELHQVSFEYGCRGKALDELSLSIPSGSTVAIVGESGSGKSTLLKLLLRLYEPSAGQVKIDGVDARDYCLESLRSRIAVVDQDPFLFNGSLRENLSLAAPQAGLEDVMAATRAAGLAEFIDQLPDRYDTRIGERGMNLSGGQRQRLALARALLRNPDLLILDEATSHLDSVTERAIQRHLQQLLVGRTAVVVAHRLSTVQFADRIYVLRDGKLCEQGSHPELVAQDGFYAQLWKTQTEERESHATRLCS
jgi:ATP-binding cassette subfamily B protein